MGADMATTIEGMGGNRFMRRKGGSPLFAGKKEKRKTFREFIERDDIGAGALIVARDTGRILLGLRGKKTNNPGVWGNQGGHVDAGERVNDGLAREIREESGYTGPIDFIPFPTGKFKENEFNFYNFIGLVPKEFKAKAMKGFEIETDKWGWFDFNDMPKPMHPIMMKQIGKVKSFVTTIINQARKGLG